MQQACVLEAKKKRATTPSWLASRRRRTISITEALTIDFPRCVHVCSVDRNRAASAMKVLVSAIYAEYRLTRLYCRAEKWKMRKETFSRRRF